MDNQISNFDTLTGSQKTGNYGQIKNEAQKNCNEEKVSRRKSIAVTKL